MQEKLEPADLPTDLETLSDEERFLFRKIGLSMKTYLLIGNLQLLLLCSFSPFETDTEHIQKPLPASSIL